MFHYLCSCCYYRYYYCYCCCYCSCGWQCYKSDRCWSSFWIARHVQQVSVPISARACRNKIPIIFDCLATSSTNLQPLRNYVDDRDSINWQKVVHCLKSAITNWNEFSAIGPPIEQAPRIPLRLSVSIQYRCDSLARHQRARAVHHSSVICLRSTEDRSVAMSSTPYSSWCVVASYRRTTVITILNDYNDNDGTAITYDL